MVFKVFISYLVLLVQYKIENLTGMSHKAQNYLSTILVGLTNPKIITKYLNLAESNTLANHLKNDAAGYIYSSIVSIGNAFQSLEEELSTWATVKLYYATFYAFRALLALDGICIFYVGSKPFSINAQPGHAPIRREGQTHKVVLEEFKKQNSGHLLLSQTIEYDDPLNWLMEKREYANYKEAKFSEPTIPKHFKKIVDNELRLALKDYLTDTSNIYLFDPDHAMLAYPLRVLQLANQKINSGGFFPLEKNEIQYLCKLFNDRLGPIPEMQKMLNDD